MTEARGQAVAALSAAASNAFPREVERIAGRPDASATVRLIGALRTSLWRDRVET
jgi:hypothetical protein